MEIFDIVDEKGIPTGETVERSIAHAEGTEADKQIIEDLLNTLRANLDRCVGVAANIREGKVRTRRACS